MQTTPLPDTNSFVKRMFDANSHQPAVICLCELSDGTLVEAIEVMGDWETMDGECIYPVRFTPLHIGIFEASYA